MGQAPTMRDLGSLPCSIAAIVKKETVGVARVNCAGLPS